MSNLSRADNWGVCYIQANTTIWSHFKVDRDKGLHTLSEYAGLPQNTFSIRDAFFQSLKVSGDWCCITYEDSDWWSILSVLKRCENVPFFASESDEYGLEQYIAKTLNEPVLEFFFEHEGDDIEEEWYIEKVIADLDKWMTLLPETLIESFPDSIRIAKKSKEQLASI